MVITPFDPQQKEFTDTVHQDYRDLIYPPLFGLSKEAVTYDELPPAFMKEADGCIALDTMVHTKFKGMREAMAWSVSFRIRNSEQVDAFQDLTITLSNDATGMPGEFSKIVTEFFTYGSYSFSLKRLVEVLVVSMPDLKRAIVHGKIQHVPYPHNPRISGYNTRSEQPFLAYRFDDLKRLGLVRLHLKEVDGVLVSQPRTS